MQLNYNSYKELTFDQLTQRPKNRYRHVSSLMTLATKNPFYPQYGLSFEYVSVRIYWN